MIALTLNAATPNPSSAALVTEDREAAHTPKNRNTMWETDHEGKMYAFTDTKGRYIKVEFGETLQRTSVGRGAVVIRALVLAVTSTPRDSSGYVDMIGKEYALKFSWVTESGVGEAHSVVGAREMVCEKDGYMEGHLPEVVAAAVLQNTKDGLRGSFFRHFTDNAKLEDQWLKVLLMEPLQPITILQTSHEVKTVFRQIAFCHDWLIRAPQILHRDISLNNLMLHKRAGNWLAVLIDFDLSIHVNRYGEPHYDHTGTMPFMAAELLQHDSVQHVRRHDLEALYWCFVWLTVWYHNGKRRQPTKEAIGTNEDGEPIFENVPAPLDDWVMASATTLRHFKRSWLTGPTLPDMENFTDLDITWHLSLPKLFTAGNQQQAEHKNRSTRYQRQWRKWKLQVEVEGGKSSMLPEPIPPKFDEATLGEIVTWEAFTKCIEG